MSDPEAAPLAEGVRPREHLFPMAEYECHQCARRFTSRNPWDCMVPGGKTYGPFCTRRCLDLWAKHFDGGRDA